MTTRRNLVATRAAGIVLATSALALAQSATPPKTGYAPVNGLQLYYEIQGAGEPLILLHGGLGSMSMFADLVRLFAKTRQVITVDLQAHGRTADIDRPITYEAMADDIAALMKYLHIEQADFIGYSLGAGVSLQATVRHPALVRRLVVVSAVFRRDGWYPGILGLMEPSPLYKEYASIAPHPGDWTVLVTKMSELLRKDYDWSKDVGGIKAPTMLVFGDADSIRPAHIVEFFTLLGGGKKDGGWDGSGISPARLAILPGVTHYNIVHSPLLAPVIGPFIGISLAGG